MQGTSIAQIGVIKSDLENFLNPYFTNVPLWEHAA